MRLAKIILVIIVSLIVLCTFYACDSEEKGTSVTDNTVLENEEKNTEAVLLKKRDTVSVTDQIVIGVTQDGGAYAAGGTLYSGDVSAVEEWENVTKVSAGTNHMLGLLSDGTVASAGRYGSYEAAGWDDIVDIHAGNEHSFGLRSDGTVVVTRLVNSDFDKWESVVDITGFGDALYGLRSDGRVYVGNSSSPVSENVKSVHANVYFAIFVKNDGTVEISDQGYLNKYNTITEWTDIVDASTYTANHVVGLCSDGTVVAAGSNRAGQCSVEEWSNIVDIAAGGTHTVGLRSDGTVVATGDNGYGQCDVENWNDIVSVFAGEFITVGIKSDGSAVATGSLWNGLGNIDEWNNMKLK